MATFQLIMGNRLETLVAALADVLRTPLGSPLEKEIILVQSRGMERWLSMQLALRLGACANVQFPFPNAFVYDIFRRTLPPLPEESPYESRFMTWRILEALQVLLEEPGFEPIRGYLREPGFSLRALQLSQRIAETFNQYVIYRPELIAAWDAGREDHWQAGLWREISKGREGQHRAALREQLLRRLETCDPADLDLPRRVSLFGISYLPPYHTQILKGLSQFMEVRIFLLSPCRHYWSDLAGPREMRKLAFHPSWQGMSPEELHLERGNSLLASMGTAGRELLELLRDLDCDEEHHFVEPGESSLLACIQSDILSLTDREAQTGGRQVLPAGDRSIQVHSCHGPMREVEVLHDQLLDLFGETPDLRPREILVMAPDIESYAPFVQAVFDAPDGSPRIPYRIADRSTRRQNRAAATLLAILELHGERLSAPQVLDILESPAVQARFGLTPSDFEVIAGWVRDVRIRWGIDEHQKGQWGPPAFRENTWRAGIDRLLLGYALPGGEERLFGGILPYDDIEGGEAAILGGLASFLGALFDFLASLDVPRTLAQWADHLLEALSRLLLTDGDSEIEVQVLKKRLAELKESQEISGLQGALALDLIRWALARSLEREGAGQGFISGGVTFCSMLPMRSIPFRVLCLMGMNESAFPRQSRPAEFDLMARSPRPGDRSLRNEDRTLFLEAVLSARDRLIITYTGQSAEDNSTIPPSVLVSELMDHIGGNFTLEGSEVGDRILVRHRLQPFHPSYFRGGGPLFSYSREHLAEARSLASARRAPPAFISGELPPPDESLRTLSVDDLARFFANPARFLLNRRLGLHLDEETGLLEDTECFELGGLDRYLIRSDLLDAAMEGADPLGRYELVRASGRLPHGTPGDLEFRELSRGVEDFASRTAPYLRSGPLEPLTVDLEVDGFRLTGTLRSLFAERMARYRYATLKARDYLDLWIPHLAINGMAEPGYPRESVLMGLEKGSWRALSYSPVENGREILASLLGLYWQGLRRPLRFFPRSSLDYAEMLLNGQKSREEALARASRTWEGNGYQGGEREDLYFDLCFRTLYPLDSEFERIAGVVFNPLLGSVREVTADG
jgi:exodeoxyribonuclease V gamma subunit